MADRARRRRLYDRQGGLHRPHSTPCVSLGLRLTAFGDRRLDAHRPPGSRPASSNSRHRGRDMKHRITLVVAAMLFLAAPATADVEAHLQEAAELVRDVGNDARVMMSKVPRACRILRRAGKAAEEAGKRGGDRAHRRRQESLPPSRAGRAERQRHARSTPHRADARHPRRGGIALFAGRTGYACRTNSDRVHGHGLGGEGILPSHAPTGTSDGMHVRHGHNRASRRAGGRDALPPGPSHGAKPRNALRLRPM